MNNPNPNILTIEKITKFIPVALSFLVPIFFLPVTSEFFEFNKMALILIGTALLGIMWILRLVSGQKVDFVKSSIDMPLIAFTSAVALSTIFSLNKTTSIYGSQGRWFPALFPILIFVAYYYLATPAIKDLKSVKLNIFSFIAGATASTLVSLLSYFNVFFGAEAYMRVSNFSLAGSTNGAIILAAAAIVAGISLLAYEDKLPTRVLLMTSVLANVFLVALIGSILGWAILAFGAIGILLMVNIKGLGKNRIESTVFIGALVALLLVNIVPNTRQVLTNNTFPTEIALTFNESWVTATSTIRDYPLLATGPSTFFLNYPRYKSLSINNTSLWNIRFDKPYNELLNVMTTLGVVGLVAALWLAARVGKVTLSGRDIKDETGTVKVACAVLISLIPVYLLTYATVLNTFVILQFLILAIAARAVSTQVNKDAELVSINFASFASVTTIGEAGSVRKEYFHYIAAAPMALLIAYAGFLFYKTYAAEYYIRQSVLAAQENLGAKVYEYQGKAVNLVPQRDTYQTAYAQTNLALANALASKEPLTDQDKQTIQTLIAQSIRSARVSTEVLNPLSVANWQTRALIYKSILNVADNAAEWAVASYNTAMQLDPSNPALRLDLGGIYYAENDFLSAANYFRQATALKPDYANAHYNFAQALIKLNDLQNAYRELELTKSLVSKDSVDYQKVEQDLAALSAQPSVAGAAAQKPTVEQITGTNPTSTTQQEPLAIPSNLPANTNLNVESITQPSTAPAQTTTKPTEVVDEVKK